MEVDLAILLDLASLSIGQGVLQVIQLYEGPPGRISFYVLPRKVSQLRF
jgi:hypothetical protein